jgi:hypothetical protein
MKGNLMKFNKKSIITLALLAVFAFTTTGCGYILAPERRGRNARSGQLDIPVIIMDVLWLIPGIIPGVIALIVDGVTGAWYKSGGKSVIGQNNQQKPINLVAGKSIQLNIKRELPANSKIKVSFVDLEGNENLISTFTTKTKIQILPLTLKINKNIKAGLGYLVISKNKTDKIWFNAKIASK